MSFQLHNPNRENQLPGWLQCRCAAWSEWCCWNQRRWQRPPWCHKRGWRRLASVGSRPRSRRQRRWPGSAGTSWSAAGRCSLSTRCQGNGTNATRCQRWPRRRVHLELTYLMPTFLLMNSLDSFSFLYASSWSKSLTSVDIKIKLSHWNQKHLDVNTVLGTSRSCHLGTPPQPPPPWKRHRVTRLWLYSSLFTRTSGQNQSLISWSKSLISPGVPEISHIEVSLPDR